MNSVFWQLQLLPFVQCVYAPVLFASAPDVCHQYHKKQILQSFASSELLGSANLVYGHGGPLGGTLSIDLFPAVTDDPFQDPSGYINFFSQFLTTSAYLASPNQGFGVPTTSLERYDEELFPFRCVPCVCVCRALAYTTLLGLICLGICTHTHR